MSGSFDLDGLTQLTESFSVAIVRVGAEGAALVRKTADDVQHDARMFCPVDTGFLQSSITTSFEGDGRYSRMTAEVGPEAFYGHYVEFGTSRMAPYAYLGPAFDRHAGEFLLGVEALAAAALGR